MSVSKLIMARKLCNVQKDLMNQEIKDDSLESLIHLCYNACLKEGLMFFFSITEDLMILKLRDITHENYELNIKHAHSRNYSTQMDDFKKKLLFNTFLLTKKSFSASSVEPKKENTVKKEDDVDESKIQMNDAAPPTAIRAAMDVLEKNGEPVTRKSIQKHLQLGKMSQDNKRRCIAYLRTMEE